MRLVERSTELSVLRNLLAASKAGRGRLAVISGAVGSGKTALLHVLGEDAIGDRVAFLWATASRAECALPLELMDQLLSGAAAYGEKDEYSAQLMATRMLADASAESGPDIREPAPQVLRGLSNALLELAVRRPLLIAVDDVHHADLPSIKCLLYLARRLGPARILMVFAECPCHRLEYLLFSAELMGLPHCQHIQLKPLSRPGVTEMLAADLGTVRAQRLAPACHELTGGSPLLIRALLQDHRDLAAADAPELIPGPAFGQALTVSLYRADAGTLDAVRGLAVLGEHASPEVLEDVLDLGLENAGLASKALAAEGVALAPGWFRHQAARDAVLQSMNSDQRRALNARAARALYERGAAAVVVAQYLIAADGVSAPWTVSVLLEAARQALADHDVRRALDFLRLAHAGSSEPRQRAAITLQMLRAEWRVSPAAAALHLPGLTAAAVRGELSERHANALIAYLLWHGSLESVMRILKSRQQRGVVLAGHDSTQARSADIIRAWLNFSYPAARLPGDGRAPPPEPRASVRSASLLGITLLNKVLRGGGADDTLSTAERILQGSRLNDDTLGSITAALLSLVCSNRLRVAGAWCDSQLKEAALHGGPAWHALLAAVSAEIDVRQGNFAAAEKSAREALDLMPPESWRAAVALPVADLVLAATRLGKLDDAASYLAIPISDATQENLSFLRYLQARGRYHLAASRPRAAMDDFQACGDLMVQWGVDLPALVPWRTEMAEAALRSGNLAKARDLATEQLVLPCPERSRAQGTSLRLLAVASDVGERVPLLTESARLLEESGELFELALTLAELSRACRELGCKDRARVLARRACRLAKACGVDLTGALQPAAAVQVAASQELAGADPLAQLSEAELRVAVLAAHGYTNRQIASLLFVTVSTVEQHLTRVYRKLRMKRRTDLPAQLQRSLVATGSRNLT
jgi:DNA-binding CsgD family transcriptional regulator